jgi:hypothetical protein
VLAGADPDERASLLSGAAALAEPVLIGAGPAFEDVDATPAALHGLYWLTSEPAAREGLLLCIDDMQWADESTVRWLLYLLGRLDGIAAGVLAAARTEERGVAEELLEPLHVHAAVETLAPAALTPRGVADVVAARLGMEPEEEFVAACRRATGGNPFLLSELVDELAATGILPIAATAGEVHEIGPRAVRRSVLSRLRRLDPACAALGRAVTVLGEGVELGAAAAYAELDPAAAATAADALAAAHILEPGRPLAFVHPIVLAAVRSELSHGELGEAHGRAARQLREEGAPAARIALHLLNAEPGHDDQAVADLREAAAEARGRGAPELAARLLRRALRERLAPDIESELLMELGTAELSSEQLQRSIDHLSRAAELSRNPRSRARDAAARRRRAADRARARGARDARARRAGARRRRRGPARGPREHAPDRRRRGAAGVRALPGDDEGLAGVRQWPRPPHHRRAAGRRARGLRAGARGIGARSARARAARLGAWRGAARARARPARGVPARVREPVGR